MRFPSIGMITLIPFIIMLLGSPCLGEKRSQLEEFKARAEAAHPSLRALETRLLAAKAKLRQSGKKPNPSLGLEVEELGGGAGGNLGEAEWNLKYSQPIQPRSMRRALRRVEQFEIEKLEHSLAAQRRLIRGRVATTWYGMLAKLSTLHQTETALALVREGVDAVQKRYEAGAASRLDFYRSLSDAQDLEAQLAKGKQSLLTARRGLAKLLHIRERSLSSLKLTTTTTLRLPDFKKAQEALRSHPQVMAAKAEIKGAKAEVDLVWAERRGEREVEAGFRRTSHAGATFTLGIRIPFLLHDRKRGAISNARLLWQASRAEAAEVRLELEEKLIEIHGKLSADKAYLDILNQQSLPTANSAFDLAREGYREGKFTFLEFLNAQKSLVELRKRIAEGQSEFYILLGEFDVLLGDDLMERRSQ